jgi:hypothetical protein
MERSANRDKPPSCTADLVGNVEQHLAEMDRDRRSRYQRAFIHRSEWSLAFRVQPAHDVIVVDNVPAGPSNRSVDLSRDRTMWISLSIGIDATRPFGEKFYDVADVPGWEDYDVPKLNGRR